jgi:hypothetical protein
MLILRLETLDLRTQITKRKKTFLIMYTFQICMETGSEGHWLIIGVDTCEREGKATKDYFSLFTLNNDYTPHQAPTVKLWVQEVWYLYYIQ